MTNEFKLIDGTFTAKEASDILINLFRNKLQFHQMKNISSLERFGKEDIAAVNRIQELKTTIEKLSELIRNAEQNNQTIHIDSKVELHFKTV